MTDISNVLPHQKSANFVDENVDQFDAFAINWNDQQALHITFGRTSLTVKNSKFDSDGQGEAKWSSGDIDVFRLNVAALTLPLGAAKALAETLTKMVNQAERRESSDAE